LGKENAQPSYVIKTPGNTSENIVEKTSCIGLPHVTSGSTNPHHPGLVYITNMAVRPWSEFHSVVIFIS
jgi:hypothetical protein